MRLSLFFATLAVVTLLALNVRPDAASAEQIRLADGRFLQGEVTEVKPDGFTFKLTDSGGKVFLRWNQVDAGLKERLKNEKDPDVGLNLEVTVTGARLELIDGTVYQGNIVRSGNNYVVTNRERNGAQISAEDVTEEGFVTGIQIDATVMMSEKEALAKAEEMRAPLDTAVKYYEMARIADKLGLYEEAKEYVTNALQTTPDARLQARLTEYETKLVDLIRQKELLVALGAARQLAKKNKYQLALDHLKEAKEKHKPTDTVLAKWEEVNLEVDLEFTKYVITEWYKLLKPVVSAKFKEKDSRDMTVNDAMNWARREMDVAIQERLATEVGSEDPANIKARFMMRHKLHEAKVIKLTQKKASFREDGFYQIVGGHLPVAGKQPQPAATPPNNNQPGGRRAPSGNGNNGNGNNGNNGNQGSQAPGGWDNEEGLQDQPKTPTPDEIREALRRILGNEDDEKKEEPGDGKNPVKQDISKLKVPNVVPTLNDWWDKAGSARSGWLIAVYVKFSGTMMLLELDNWDIKYR